MGSVCVRDLFFELCRTGFQNLDRIKDVSKQSKQLDELTAKTREAKRYLCLLHSLHSIMSLWVTEDHSLCTTMAMGDGYESTAHSFHICFGLDEIDSTSFGYVTCFCGVFSSYFSNRQSRYSASK
jgi:hypothetical protein